MVCEKNCDSMWNIACFLKSLMSCCPLTFHRSSCVRPRRELDWHHDLNVSVLSFSDGPSIHSQKAEERASLFFLFLFTWKSRWVVGTLMKFCIMGLQWHKLQIITHCVVAKKITWTLVFGATVFQWKVRWSNVSFLSKSYLFSRAVSVNALWLNYRIN